MLVLLGSRALQHYGWNEREPRDTDLLGDLDEVLKFRLRGCRASYPINEGKKWIIKNPLNIIEAELTWPGSLSEELLKLCLTKAHRSHDGLMIPTLDILYMLKMSHRYLKNSPHFLKTMRDIQWMRSQGASLSGTELLMFFKKREAETYVYTHPSLMKSKNSFFSGDGITYLYDHDSIHEAVATGFEPAYRTYQKDGAEVACDKAKWDALPTYKKLYGVLEEAYVLALERSQIPYRGQIEPEKSFNMALMKVCTSITSGWFREFAWENYDKVQALYDPHYVNKFWKKAENGSVSKMH